MPTISIRTPLSPTTVATAAASASVYVVRAGDNCYDIAQKLGVPLNDLLNANKLTLRCKLQIGDTLVVPSQVTTSQIATPAIAVSTIRAAIDTPTATVVAIPATYLVRAGDTCLGIARKLSVELDALAAANKLRVSYCFIRPGDRLVVPHS